MDHALRAQERALDLEGDRAERVALLAAARRRGDERAEWRLRVAATLGESHSRAAIGLEPEVSCARLAGCVLDFDHAGSEVRGQHDASCPLPSAFDLERWLGDLRRLGAEVSVRAALAAARTTLTWWDSLQGWTAVEEAGAARLERRHYLDWSAEERHRRPRLLLDAVERWVLAPSPESRRALAACKPAAADERPFAYLDRLADELALEGAPRATSIADEGPQPALETVLACRQFLPEEHMVRDAIRDALLPWVLGEGDPLAAIARLPVEARAAPLTDDPAGETTRAQKASDEDLSAEAPRTPLA